MDKINDRQDLLTLLSQVDEMNEEVKVLAINLAIYLAKSKSSSDKLTNMEPEFVKLVNGTIKAVQEISHILKAANNTEKMIFQVQSGKEIKDHIETKLDSVMDQCHIIKAKLAITEQNKAEKYLGNE